MISSLFFVGISIALRIFTSLYRSGNTDDYAVRSKSIHEFLEFTDGLQIDNLPNFMNRVLDLVIIDKRLFKCDIGLLKDVLVKMDRFHPVIFVDIDICSIPRPGIKYVNKKDNVGQPGINQFDFTRANFEELWRIFNDADWSPVLKEDNIEIANDRFYEIVESIFNVNITRFHNQYRIKEKWCIEIPSLDLW